MSGWCLSSPEAAPDRPKRDAAVRLRAPRRLAAVLLLAVGLGGCGIFSPEQADPTLRMTPEQLYAEARDEMSSGRYGEAIKLLAKLESRYPFGSWAQQAQMDTAFAHYREGSRAQALVAVERFIRLHPSSEYLDYAYYLKGLINFNDEQGLLARLGRQDLSERDQRATREAFEAFRQVVTRFPTSKYADDSLARMRYLVNAMASGDVHIARFYFLRGAYVAAASRAQEVIQQYQETPAVEEALFILMKSYERLGLDELRADAERLMRANFPKSEYYARGVPAENRRWWQVWR
jgi:outer membrane protein assembly factor BamD